MRVEYIDHMGDDERVCAAARISFARKVHGFTTEQNVSLINYLAKNGHWSPFSHVYVSLAVQAPIAIKAQCDKHVVGFSTNTESRRYISTLPEFYVPIFREKPCGSIKQGSGDIHVRSDDWVQEYVKHQRESISLYDRMIKDGVAPEQARFVLPQGVETNWVWTGSLYAWARFYNQRTDTYAQKEIQELAYRVGDIIAPLYPHSWEALVRDC